MVNRRNAAQHKTANDPWDCEASTKFTGLVSQPFPKQALAAE